MLSPASQANRLKQNNVSRKVQVTFIYPFFVYKCHVLKIFPVTYLLSAAFNFGGGCFLSYEIQ